MFTVLAAQVLHTWDFVSLLCRLCQEFIELAPRAGGTWVVKAEALEPTALNSHRAENVWERPWRPLRRVGVALWEKRQAGVAVHWNPRVRGGGTASCDS